LAKTDMRVILSVTCRLEIGRIRSPAVENLPAPWTLGKESSHA